MTDKASVIQPQSLVKCFFELGQIFLGSLWISHFIRLVGVGVMMEEQSVEQLANQLAEQPLKKRKQYKRTPAQNRDHNRRRKIVRQLDKLTEAEERFMEARLSGATLKEAAVAAGHSPYDQTGHRIEQRIREKAPEVFNRFGVSVDRLAGKINELLDKRKTQYYTSVVLDSKEVDDTAAQIRAVEFGMRVHGLDKSQLEVNADVTHTHTIDMSNATQDEIDALLRAMAPFRRALPSGAGPEVCDQPIDVATGGRVGPPTGEDAG